MSLDDDRFHDVGRFQENDSSVETEKGRFHDHANHLKQIHQIIMQPNLQRFSQLASFN